MPRAEGDAEFKEKRFTFDTSNYFYLNSSFRTRYIDLLFELFLRRHHFNPCRRFSFAASRFSFASSSSWFTPPRSKSLALIDHGIDLKQVYKIWGKRTNKIPFRYPCHLIGEFPLSNETPLFYNPFGISEIK